MRRTLSRSALTLFATASLAASGAVVAQQPAAELPGGQIPAVLKAHEVDFIYRSTNNVLACDELRNRVATVLRELGARDDVQVTARECDLFVTSGARSPRSSDPSVSGTFQPGTGGDLTGSGDDLFKSPIDRQMERRQTLTHGDRYDRYKSQSTPVHIRLMLPVVITPAILEEAERDKARRELISRVQGNPSAAMDNPIYFAAERREVTLSHDTIDLEPVDCELLEQMSRTVLRELDLKVTSRALSCDSHSSLKPQLKVQALLPVGYLMPGEQQLAEKQRKRAEKSAPPPATESPPPAAAPPPAEAPPQPETPAQ